MNPIKHFSDWRKYRKALKAMNKCLELQKSLGAKDGDLTGDDAKLFEMYVLSFCINAAQVVEYQAKYHK